MDIEKLEKEYHTLAPLAQRLALTLANEIRELLLTNGLRLAVPIENRIKTWQSIAAKLERKSLDISTMRDLPDLVGVRIILLFVRDVSRACDLFSSTFDIVEVENKADALGDSQFGYLSRHFLIKLPQQWLSLPSLTSLGALTAEIQLRTVSQHIWAAASHILQYKSESTVPAPIRRTINRVSALLETVDLEFERVLTERDAYRQETTTLNTAQHLNVDLLEKVLDEVLPAEHKWPEEDYAAILEEFEYVGIDTVDKLKKFLSSAYDKVMQKNQQEAKNARGESDARPYTTRERVERGIFYTHSGLVRVALEVIYGSRSPSKERKGKRRNAEHDG